MRAGEDDIYDMSIKETESAARQAAIEQKIHPGFECFFQDFLHRQAITFNECFNQLVQGSYNINNIKLSIPNILASKDMPVDSKKRALMNKEHKYLYVYKDQLGLKTELIDQTEKEENTLSMLERRLLFYQENKKKVLNEKLE